MPRISLSNITDPVVYGLRRVFDAMRHSLLLRIRRRGELNMRVDGNPAASSCRRRRRRRRHPGPISRLSSTCELHHAVCEIELRHAYSSRALLSNFMENEWNNENRKKNLVNRIYHAISFNLFQFAISKQYYYFAKIYVTII